MPDLDKDGLPKRRRGRPSAKEVAEREALLAERNQRKFQIPAAFMPLYEPHRYKIFYGGRGAAKSWDFADAVVTKAWQRPLRVLCTRELQNSIRESVHQLLRDRIVALGFQSQYHITEAEIRGANGSLFLFKGLRHNVEEIKSIEGVDICWVEEGQKVSAQSWDILIPTIRKADSEIWVSMNVGLKSDPAYQRFVLNPPSNAYVKKVSWRDNPWFPEVLRLEMEDLKAKDYEKYLHVWEGELQAFADGAYYKKELIAAREEKRICQVPYDPLLKVHTVWDLGVGDATSIIFAQLHGKEVRHIDYYENSGEGLPHYAQVLQRKPYVYGDHWAPHDIRVRELGSGKSRLEQAKGLGIAFNIVPNIPVDDGIAAVRSTLPLSWFDEIKCARLIECLANYSHEWDDERKDWKVRPLHNWASHAADAERYLAVGLKEKPVYKEPEQLMNSSATGWMR